MKYIKDINNLQNSRLFFFISSDIIFYVNGEDFMKKVIYLVLVATLLIPGNIFASTYLNEYPPYIRLSNSERYDVEKIIDSEHITIRIKEKNEKNYYSWTFDKNEVGDTIDIDFEVTFNSDKEDLMNNIVGNINKKMISFKHHGPLPSKATITVYVGDQYKNGQNLNLYYFNEEENKIEEIDTNLKVAKGYVEFEISHCSDYFLTNKDIYKKDESVVEKININYIIIGMGSVIFILTTKLIMTMR